MIPSIETKEFLALRAWFQLKNQIPCGLKSKALVQSLGRLNETDVRLKAMVLKESLDGGFCFWKALLEVKRR